MRLLLHICCGPCLIYPLERLRQEGFKVNGYFYNPNIHPFSEYENRKSAVEFFKDIEVIYPDYRPEDFFRAVNLKEEKFQRCPLCWELRLKKTAQAAKKEGFDSFSTTLLVSPYQDQELLKSIGNNVAQEEGINFYYEDFRPGFRNAHNQAKAQGLYCQKYCGCLYSCLPAETKKCRKSEKR